LIINYPLQQLQTQQKLPPCVESERAMNDQFQFVSRLLDEYEQSGQHNKATLITYQKRVDDIWKQFSIVNDKLLEINDSAPVDLIGLYKPVVTIKHSHQY
jgi:hypothetical protein